ncbi:MAG: putative glycoside hydrolase [Candidatus Falkowbacteria bacterium]
MKISEFLIKHPKLSTLLTIMVSTLFLMWLLVSLSLTKIDKMQIAEANDLAGVITTSFNGIKDEVVLEIKEIKREKVKEKEIHGIYLTAYSAGSPTKVDKIIASIKGTAINAVIIDIKDYSGYLSYDSNIPMVSELKLEQVKIKNIKGVVEKLHQNNIYTIARIAVFQDPALSSKKKDWAVMNKNTNQIWKDNKGLSWLDPANPAVWKYHTEIAKEAIDLGFDEINLDYVRFPSDGPISAMVFPKWKGEGTKADVIKRFFTFFAKELMTEPAYTSVDLFGLVTTIKNDMNIGQLLENATPYFDYVCPMVYPSHYPNGYMGFNNPANYPYEIIYKATKTANERIASSTPSRAKIRPWIQDFDLGATYTSSMVKKEIKAIKDSGGFGYLVWDPKNIYTWEAFK